MSFTFGKVLITIYLFIFPLWVYGGNKTIVTLFFTSSNNGMLKHCDCPVDNRGGLARRKTLLDSLKQITKNCFVLDTGNFLSSYRRLEWDRKVLKIYKHLGYTAVNVGSYELKYGLSFLSEMSSLGIYLISANLMDSEKEDLVTIPYKKEIIKGKSFLIIGLISSKAIKFLPDEPKSEIEIAPYVFSLKTILKKVNEKNPIVIILSQLTEEENLSLIDTVPQKINVILGNCSRDYPNGWYRIYKNTILAKAGVGGKTVGKVKMVFDKDWNRSDCSVDFISVGDNLRENPQIIHLLNQWRVE